MKPQSYRRTLGAISASFLVAASAAIMLVSNARADTPRQESAGAILDDTVITSKVKAAFVKDEKVSALRISVTSDKGIVQLSGFANSPVEAERAAEVARNVPGVKDVKNDIILKPAPY